MKGEKKKTIKLTLKMIRHMLLIVMITIINTIRKNIGNLVQIFLHHLGKSNSKKKEAEDLPASCEDFGFDCSLPECGADNIRYDLGENEEKPLFVTVTNSEFHYHKIDKNGTAICLINYGLNGTGTILHRVK